MAAWPLISWAMIIISMFFKIFQKEVLRCTIVALWASCLYFTLMLISLIGSFSVNMQRGHHHQKCYTKWRIGARPKVVSTPSPLCNDDIVHLLKSIDDCIPNMLPLVYTIKQQPRQWLMVTTKIILWGDFDETWQGGGKGGYITLSAFPQSSASSILTKYGRDEACVIPHLLNGIQTRGKTLEIAGNKGRYNKKGEGAGYHSFCEFAETAYSNQLNVFFKISI